MINTIEYNLINELFEYKNGFLFRKIARGKKFKENTQAGRLHPNGYRYVNINKKNYLEHRIIFLMLNGYLPKEIDHIDGNPNNNKIENLREANHSQNSFNTKIRTDNTSGVKCVAWNKLKQKWTVRMVIDGKRKFLGDYDELAIAKIVADTARLNHHKEFARNV